MYICPICNQKFQTKEIIAKHSLQCWREHNLNYKSKSAPHSYTTKQEINKDVMNFFASFKKG